MNKDHLVKFGVEFNQYDLTADIVRYEPRMTYFGKPIAGVTPAGFQFIVRLPPALGFGVCAIQDRCA